MKIEVLKENLKKQTCKFTIDDKTLLTKTLPVFIELNIEDDKGHLNTKIKLFPGAKQEFSFLACDDSNCIDGCNFVSSYPTNTDFLQKRISFSYEIMEIIQNEIEFFKLKCEIFDNRKRLIPWIKQTLIKESDLTKHNQVDYFR